MKTTLCYLCLGVGLIFSCTQNKKKQMLVTGKIKGLRKGTLYLQTFKNQSDTVMQVVDSVFLKGREEYQLKTFVQSPKMYTLSLGKNTDKSIEFFGENVAINIDADLKFFAVKNKIKAGALQAALEKYLAIVKKMNFRRLERIKQSIEARKAKKFQKADSLQSLINDFHKRKFLYTLNYAMTHPDTEVTPYIVLQNLQSLTIKYLDSINNNLNKKVQKSFYGKALQNFIQERKKGN